MNERPQRDVDERLADWVDGCMSEKERERFVAELRVNTQLRQDLERYERTVGVVRAALRAPAPSAGIADRVMAAIAAPASPPARRWNVRSIGWCFAAAAAVLAAAVWIDAWTPAAPSGHDTAAVDDARDAGLASDAPAAEPAAKPDAEKQEGAALLAVEEANRPGGILVPAPEPAPAPPTTVAPAREQGKAEGWAGGKVEQPAPPRAVKPPEDRFAARAGSGGAAPAPSAPSPSGPATGGPGARSQPLPMPDAAPVQEEVRKEAGDDKAGWRDGERADALVPLLVVEGLAVAPPAGDAKAAAAKDQGARRGAPLAGGGDASKVKGGEGARQDDLQSGATARLDDAALQARVDAFLADAASAVTAPAAIGWTTARGELRLSPMVETIPEAAPQAGDKAGAQQPIVRTWLVEGTRADLEILLGRLTRFSEQHKLTRRTEQTKPPAEKTTSDGIEAEKNETGSLRLRETATPKPEVSRMILRFRLRSR